LFLPENENPDMSAKEQYTVLVVEDELLVRLDLVETLQRAGYRTFEAGTAREAISLLEKHPEICVVFTDIEMPGTMDGLALAHYVRFRWPPTIIVISSGQIRPTQELLPTEVDFLVKPYHARELERVFADIGRRLSA
jgi:two-component system, response regulator PdtaR